MQETIITFSPRIFLPWRKSSESFLGVLEKSIWTRRSPYSSLNPGSPTRTTLARERRRRPRSPVEANRLWRMVSVLFPSRSLVMIIPRTRGKMFWSDIARGEQRKHFIFADRSGKKHGKTFWRENWTGKLVGVSAPRDKWLFSSATFILFFFLVLFKIVLFLFHVVVVFLRFDLRCFHANHSQIGKPQMAELSEDFKARTIVSRFRAFLHSRESSSEKSEDLLESLFDNTGTSNLHAFRLPL